MIKQKNNHMDNHMNNNDKSKKLSFGFAHNILNVKPIFFSPFVIKRLLYSLKVVIRN